MSRDLLQQAAQSSIYLISNASLIQTFNDSNVTSNTSDICDMNQQYSKTSFIIAGVVMLMVIMFGVPANVVNLFIFCHRTMRQTSIINWYLAFLSAADLLQLASSLLIFSFPILAEWGNNLELANALTRAMFVAYPIGLMGQTASVWLTVCVSAHRFVVVYFPYQAHRFCTKKVAKRTITGVLLFSLVYNISRFFELKSLTCYSAQYNGTLLYIGPKPIRNNDIYVSYYHGWLYMLIMLAIPFLMLIGMNSLVIWSVHKSRIRHMTSDVISRKEALKERKTTTMLIGIVAVFLGCNTLALANNIVEVNRVQTDQTLIDISNLLVVLNASMNIILYGFFSDKFRTILKYYFCPWSKGKLGNSSIQLERLISNVDHI